MKPKIVILKGLLVKWAFENNDALRMTNHFDIRYNRILPEIIIYRY